MPKLSKPDIVFLRYDNFIEDIITDWWKVDFEKKALEVWKYVQSIGILAIQSTLFTWKHCFAPNPSSNLKIKYWIFQSMWNLKIDFETIFWDILTLHPQSCLPTTGTFRYVESHFVFYFSHCMAVNACLYPEYPTEDRQGFRRGESSTGYWRKSHCLGQRESKLIRMNRLHNFINSSKLFKVS